MNVSVNSDKYDRMVSVSDLEVVCLFHSPQISMNVSNQEKLILCLGLYVYYRLIYIVKSQEKD